MLITLTVFEILLSILIISITEWYLHKYHMHRPGFINKISPGTYYEHTKLHHGRYYKVFDYEPDPIGRITNIMFKLGTSILTIMPIALIISLLSVQFAIILSIIGFLDIVIWNTIHEEMHIPNNRFFSNWRIYKYLREHHRLHHKHPGKNFNVVIPLMDYIIGTKI
jgi:hypothetical protein